MPPKVVLGGFCPCWGEFRRIASQAVGAGFYPPARDAPETLHNGWQTRKMSVGVDAALSPAECNHKIAHTIGENAQRPVGADASVRPLGTTVLPQRFVKTVVPTARVDVGIDPYKRYTDSPGCIRVCGCVPPGGQRRPPLRVHTILHWCAWICNIVPHGRGRTPPLRQINTSSLFTITSYLPRPSPTLRRNALHLKTHSPPPHSLLTVCSFFRRMTLFSSSAFGALRM